MRKHAGTNRRLISRSLPKPSLLIDGTLDKDSTPTSIGLDQRKERTTDQFSSILAEGLGGLYRRDEGIDGEDAWQGQWRALETTA